MGFGKAIASCLGKFFSFAGRAPRSEYWNFYLFFLICVLVGAVIHALALIAAVIVLFFPQLSVSIRRLHDVNRSGWWWWLSFIPLVGPLVLLVWACTRGTEGENDYGPDPLNPVPVGVFD